MVKVILNLLNIFYLKINKKSIEYEANTVGDAISQFISQFKDRLDDSMLSKNKKKLNPLILVLLNGRNIEYLKKYKTKLNEGDQLYLSYPLSGG